MTEAEWLTHARPTAMLMVMERCNICVGQDGLSLCQFGFVAQRGVMIVVA